VRRSNLKMTTRAARANDASEELRRCNAQQGCAVRRIRPPKLAWPCPHPALSEIFTNGGGYYLMGVAII